METEIKEEPKCIVSFKNIGKTDLPGNGTSRSMSKSCNEYKLFSVLGPFDVFFWSTPSFLPGGGGGSNITVGRSSVLSFRLNDIVGCVERRVNGSWTFTPRFARASSKMAFSAISTFCLRLRLLMYEIKLILLERFLSNSLARSSNSSI